MDTFLIFSLVCPLLCFKIISQQLHWAFYGSQNEAGLFLSQRHWSYFLSGSHTILLKHVFRDFSPHIFLVPPQKSTAQRTLFLQAFHKRVSHILSPFPSQPWCFSILSTGIFFFVVFSIISTNTLFFFFNFYTVLILHWNSMSAEFSLSFFFLRSKINKTIHFKCNKIDPIHIQILIICHNPSNFYLMHEAFPTWFTYISLASFTAYKSYNNYNLLRINHIKSFFFLSVSWQSPILADYTWIPTPIS